MYNVKDWIERYFASPPDSTPSTFLSSASMSSAASSSSSSSLSSFSSSSTSSSSTSSSSSSSSSMANLNSYPSEPPRSWTRQDYLHTLLAVLILLGDGVEMYLPGVITQKVACELGVSKIQEGVLAVVLYFSCAIAVTISGPILKRFGEKLTIISSLYLSILFVILCAVVPNYYTLVASRALTGICVGLNICIVGIYLAKNISTKEILTQSLFLSDAFALPIGGAWVSFLGWLLLDYINWRIFVLLTSVPLFVPPILIIHIFMTKKQEEVSLGDSDKLKCSAANDKSIPTENEGLMENQRYSIPNFYTRVFKSSLFAFCTHCIGFGSIILVPWVMRSFKINGVHEDEVDKCIDTVHGNDFLILVIVTGAVNIIGRPVGYFLWNRVKFLIFQSTVTATMALCFAIILATDNYIASVILLAVIKFCFSVQSVEMTMLLFDYDYFGKSGLEYGCVITAASGCFGGAAGTFFGAFLHPNSAVMASFGIACVELLVICFMRERF